MLWRSAYYPKCVCLFLFNGHKLCEVIMQNKFDIAHMMFVFDWLSLIVVGIYDITTFGPLRRIFSGGGGKCPKGAVLGMS